MIHAIILYVLTLVNLSYTANIFAVFPAPSYSHQIAVAPIWRELSLRGHKVTVVTTDPTNDPKLTNLTEIDTHWLYKHFSNITQEADAFSLWNLPATLKTWSSTITTEMLLHPSIRELFKKTKKFDVVIVEHFFPEFLVLGDIHRCPKILASTLDTYAHFHRYMGNVAHPIAHPEFGLPENRNFMDRVWSFLYNRYVWYYYLTKTAPAKEELLYRHLNTRFSVVGQFSDIDLMIVNVNPVVQGVRAMSPTTITIGGYRPAIVSPKPLPKDLQIFLDSAKEGFIYFSLGSNVKSKDLGERTLKSIIAALSEVPYKVLWKFEADSLPGKPDNVKLVKWAPQIEILSHPNIKLFVTQGGLQSMEEGIYKEVPFVIIPFFGDQDMNADLMQARGIGKIVNRKPFIEREALKDAMLEVIQNASYKAAVRRLRQLSLDTPMGGLEKAVWWIEYAIRNNGTKHLRSPVLDMPFYQYYLLDVTGFLLLLTVITVWAMIVGFKILLRCIPCRYIIMTTKLKKQ